MANSVPDPQDSCSTSRRDGRSGGVRSVLEESTLRLCPALCFRRPIRLVGEPWSAVWNLVPWLAAGVENIRLNRQTLSVVHRPNRDGAKGWCTRIDAKDRTAANLTELFRHFCPQVCDVPKRTQVSVYGSDFGQADCTRGLAGATDPAAHLTLTLRDNNRFLRPERSLPRHMRIGPFEWRVLSLCGAPSRGVRIGESSCD